jgi:hypothetical protein
VAFQESGRKCEVCLLSSILASLCRMYNKQQKRGHIDLHAQDNLREAEAKEAKSRQHMLFSAAADQRCAWWWCVWCVSLCDLPCCRLLSAGALDSLADVQREMRALRAERERDDATRQRMRFNPALAREILLRNEPSLHDANLAPPRRRAAELVSFVQLFVPFQLVSLPVRCQMQFSVEPLNTGLML